MKAAMPVRAAIVEDDTFTRLTLVEALCANGIDVVYESDSASAAVKDIPIVKPDVVVLDLHLGAGPTGIDLGIELRKQAPRLGVVLLTSFDDPRLLGPSLPAPPAGTQYLPKRSVSSITVLLEALRDAIGAAGNPVPKNPRVKKRAPETSTVTGLSDTQVDTLRLVAQGFSNAEIARRRNVSEGAVEAAISRLIKTLGVGSLTTQNQRVHLAQVYFRSRGLSVDES